MSNDFTNVQKYCKCADIYYCTDDELFIICLFCNMKLFSLKDLLHHFKNLHFKNEKSVMEKEFEPFEELFEISVDIKDKENNGNIDLIDPLPSDNNLYKNHKSKSVKNKERKKNDYSCAKCDKVFKTESTLLRHQSRLHLHSEASKCVRCNKEFVSQQLLSDHYTIAHGGIPCPECPKVFKIKDSLKLHALLHTGVKSYLCDFEKCGKAFFNRKRLSAHKRFVHSTERNYVCEICGYRTNVKGALIIHKRYHTGEKPHICSTCKKGFASHSLLSVHKEIHSKERPHICEICGKSFAIQKALYHHRHLHLAEKKHICKICNQSYAQAAGLSSHMKKHKMGTKS